MKGLILATHSRGLAMTGEQLRVLRQDKDALPQRLYQLCKLHWGIGMPGAVGEHGVTNQPAMAGQFHAYAARRVTRQVMYARTAVAKAHNLAIEQLEIGCHRQEFSVGRVHTDGSVRGLAHFGQSTDMIGMAVREQDSDQLRASDCAEQGARIIPWIDEQGMCCTAEEDITIGLKRTYRKTQYVHLHRMGALLLLSWYTNSEDRSQNRRSLCWSL